jgi:hypothetical protein
MILEKCWYCGDYHLFVDGVRMGKHNGLPTFFRVSSPCGPSERSREFTFHEGTDAWNCTSCSTPPVVPQPKKEEP